MKKYFIFAAAALLALAACSKVTPAEQPDQEITFSVANYLSSTKAETGVKYYPTASFGTYAFIQAGGETFANASDPLTKYMDNVSVSLNTTSNQWVPAGTYYWPKQSTLTFASYSPYKGTAPIPTYTKANGWAVSNYEVVEHTLAGTDADAAYDLMFSDVSLSQNCTSTTNANGADIFDNGAPNTTDSQYNGVPTLFKHQLSKVGFVFQTVKDVAAPTVKSHEITIVSASVVAGNKASFLEIATTGAGWSASTTGAPYVYLTSKSLGVMDGETDPVATDEVTKILLPQAMTPTPPFSYNYTDAKFAVDDPANGYSATVTAPTLILKYTVKTTYNDNSVITENCRRMVALADAVKVESTADFSKWESNKYYIYTVTISPFADEKITFDPAVKAWEDPVNANISVE